MHEALIVDRDPAPSRLGTDSPPRCRSSVTRAAYRMVLPMACSHHGSCNSDQEWRLWRRTSRPNPAEVRADADFASPGQAKVSRLVDSRQETCKNLWFLGLRTGKLIARLHPSRASGGDEPADIFGSRRSRNINQRFRIGMLAWMVPAGLRSRPARRQCPSIRFLIN
jgi:hypothetical protein